MELNRLTHEEIWEYFVDLAAELVRTPKRKLLATAGVLALPLVWRYWVQN